MACVALVAVPVKRYRITHPGGLSFIDATTAEVRGGCLLLQIDPGDPAVFDYLPERRDRLETIQAFAEGHWFQVAIEGWRGDPDDE